MAARWFRDMNEIDFSQNQRYTVKEESSRSSITSFLEITDARRLDSALFTCKVSNPFGSGESTNIQLIVQGEIAGKSFLLNLRSF